MRSGILRRALASGNVRRGDAIASKIPVGVQVGKPAWALWLPNLRNIFYVALTQAYWMAESVKLEAPPVREVSGVGTSH
ncbi:hypothetical protein [uncultured Nostoc sp.]|uniref:hypothetical protein n=1 Tax=uncultured Nostoc sp. TaxID=340711 RepID=UPI002603DE02|nr:hypothetical protein [uncultured Nostoc sp.]